MDSVRTATGDIGFSNHVTVQIFLTSISQDAVSTVRRLIVHWPAAADRDS